MIGVLGPKGSYTEEAARKIYPKKEMDTSYLSPERIINDVARFKISKGVVPIENSIEGGVNTTLDALAYNRSQIIKETIMPINHCLACIDKEAKFKKIVSHPQAIEQCREYINTQYPGIEVIPAASTSHAAKKIKNENLTNTLVICSEYAAQIYGLIILKKGIQTHNNNETRFVVIGNETPKPTGNDKTSIIFSVKDKPGILSDILLVFKNQDINLTRIESRPTKKNLGDYVFYIDFEGHTEQDHVKQALEQIKEHTLFTKILGTYPTCKK